MPRGGIPPCREEGIIPPKGGTPLCQEESIIPPRRITPLYQENDQFMFEEALLCPTETVIRHLVFSRKGNTLAAMIDGTVYVRTIDKEISDVATLRAAPLRFRGNHVNSSDQSLYIEVTNIVIECRRRYMGAGR